MNQDVDKPIPDFTEKQRDAYKLVMKKTANRPLSRIQIVRAIRSENIYQRKRDIKETALMLVQNPYTPLKKSKSKIYNQHSSDDYES
jgi:hypothetical protein